MKETLAKTTPKAALHASPARPARPAPRAKPALPARPALAALLTVLTVLVLPVLLVPRTGRSTTWASATKNCPVCSNKVTGHSPASYGSYIYRWPSKVFLVFWPWTAGQWWWICPRCGYAALGPDFAKLTPKERTAIRTHVKSKWKKPKLQTFATKIRQAEACYKHRNRKPSFWVTFYRAAAWNLGGASGKGAAAYRRKALKLMEQTLSAAKGLDGRTRKEYHYLAGEFYRLDGKRAEAVKHLKIALKTKWAVGGKVNPGGDKYVNDLINASLAKLKAKKSK